tara:strand:- start:803 stop:1231 length:429 start_codon:yes stop_codon:yes gene_type:complete
MAFNISSDNDEMVENHDINVTPLVDVMLVLLIIVMVAAPLATVNVPVDLPSSSAEQSPPPDKPFYITVGKDLSITLGEEQATTIESLKSHLDSMLDSREQRIFLRADKELSYQDLMTIMNALVASGYSQIALVGVEAVAEST